MLSVAVLKNNNKVQAAATLGLPQTLRQDYVCSAWSWVSPVES